VNESGDEEPYVPTVKTYRPPKNTAKDVSQGPETEPEIEPDPESEPLPQDPSSEEPEDFFKGWTRTRIEKHRKACQEAVFPAVISFLRARQNLVATCVGCVGGRCRACGGDGLLYSEAAFKHARIGAYLAKREGMWREGREAQGKRWLEDQHLAIPVAIAKDTDEIKGFTITSVICRGNYVDVAVVIRDFRNGALDGDRISWANVGEEWLIIDEASRPPYERHNYPEKAADEQ
jgi:hypothetical protein